MGKKLLKLSSVDEVRRVISLDYCDGFVENSIAHFMNSSGLEERKACLDLFLLHESINIRSMGLRLVKRTIRDAGLLEYVIFLAFNVEQYSALENWYKAFLARYSISSFGRLLCLEMLRRQDVDFSVKNIRALEMYRASNKKIKMKTLDRVKRCFNTVHLSVNMSRIAPAFTDTLE